MSLVRNPFTEENPYVPDETDENFINAAKIAIMFSYTETDFIVEHEIYSYKIQKIFGNKARGNYLRNSLLKCTNNHYEVGNNVCKKYVLLLPGLKQLLKMVIGYEPKTIKEVKEVCNKFAIEYLEEEHKDLLSDLSNGTLTYMDKSYRLYNPLQNIRKDVRKVLLAKYGFIHDYDIKVAALTLLIQHSKMLGLKEDLPTLNMYLENRTKYRKDLAKLLDIPVSDAKQIITTLINGGRILKSVAEIVGNDKRKIKLLQESEFINNFKAEISLLWKPINLFNDATRLNCVDRAERYRMLERMVLDSVVEYLDITSNKRLLIHDGWVTQSKVDVKDLNRFVLASTGFKINLDYELFSLPDDANIIDV